MPPKWQSPLLAPSERGGDTANSGATTTIAADGIYGFCFGHPDFPLEHARAGVSMSTTAKDGGCTPYCGCECLAEVGTLEATNGNERISISLPLPTDGAVVRVDQDFRLDQLLLTSTCIGRAIYCPKGTTVRVRHHKHSPTCPPSTCQLRYRIVLHRELFQKEKENGSMISSLQYINLNPDETEKKRFICGECGKKLPSIKSIQAHYTSVHVASASSSAPVAPCAIGILPAILRRPLGVAFIDESLAVVIKPQGVNTMGGRPSLARSDLFMALKTPQSSASGPHPPMGKPVAVHRLDSPTGGLLIVAKTKHAEVELKKSFQERTCHKRYRAIVFGRLSGASAGHEGPGKLPTGEINSPISGKPSVTRWEVASYTRCPLPAARGWVTTVDLYPITGRKHQLRRHMKELKHPIWGDTRYGPYIQRKSNGVQPGAPEEDDPLLIRTEAAMLSVSAGLGDLLDAVTVATHPHARLCLYALEIAFPHPVSQRETLVAMDEPRFFNDLRCWCCETIG